MEIFASHRECRRRGCDLRADRLESRYAVRVTHNGGEAVREFEDRLVGDPFPFEFLSWIDEVHAYEDRGRQS